MAIEQNVNFNSLPQQVQANKEAIAFLRTHGIILQPKGVWDATVQYDANDFVAFNGSSYYAVQANKGYEPSLTSQMWQLVSQAGAPGADGTDGVNGVVYVLKNGATIPADADAPPTNYTFNNVNNLIAPTGFKVGDTLFAYATYGEPTPSQAWICTYSISAINGMQITLSLLANSPQFKGTKGEDGVGISSIFAQSHTVIGNETVTNIIAALTDGQQESFEIHAKNGSDGGITVDDALSTTSINPVQNKVVSERIYDSKTQINTLKNEVTNLYNHVYDSKTQINTLKNEVTNLYNHVTDLEDALSGVNLYQHNILIVKAGPRAYNVLFTIFNKNPAQFTLNTVSDYIECLLPASGYFNSGVSIYHIYSVSVTNGLLNGLYGDNKSFTVVSEYPDAFTDTVIKII